MSWASRRQFKYLLGVLIFFGLIIFAFTYPLIFKKPTCFDGKKNGEERGVDCGGECMRVCLADTSIPNILWSRAFLVTGNNYNLVAFIENQNKDIAVKEISYVFKIYDTNNKLIGRREGVTYIPPNKQFAVFEPRFNSGENIVKSVSFEFTSEYVWVKKSSIINTLAVVSDNILMSENTSSPSLSARISNNSIYDVPGFDVIAILYDAEHNAINSSKTYVKGLNSNEKSTLLFTWPEPLSQSPVIKDILIQINPFSISF